VKVSTVLVFEQKLLSLIQDELFQYFEVKMRFDHVLNVHHSIDLHLSLVEHKISSLKKRCEPFEHSFKLRHLEMLVLS